MIDRDRDGLASDPETIRRARKLAGILARRGGCLAHAEDLESAAMVGLVEAARSFEPDRGLAFWTHAGHRIRGAVLDEIRRIRRGGYGGATPLVRRGEWVPTASLDEPDDLGRSIGHVIPSGELPVGWEVESEDEVEAILSRCGKGGELVRDIFLSADRCTQAAASAARGWNPSYGSILMSDVVDLLRDRAALNGTPKPRPESTSREKYRRECGSHGEYFASNGCPQCRSEKAKARREATKSGPVASPEWGARPDPPPPVVRPNRANPPRDHAPRESDHASVIPAQTHGSPDVALGPELDAIVAVVKALRGVAPERRRKAAEAAVGILDAIGE